MYLDIHIMIVRNEIIYNHTSSKLLLHSMYLIYVRKPIKNYMLWLEFLRIHIPLNLNSKLL